MKLLPRLLAAYKRWIQANGLKQLKDMSSVYLAVVTALSSLFTALLAPVLVKATQVFAHQWLPAEPWWVSAAVFLWLLAWWVLLGIFAAMATTHGHALGERLFNSPPTGLS